MDLWRIHLRPKGKTAESVVSYCIENSCFGLGWGIPTAETQENVSQYLKRHRGVHGKRKRSVHAILEKVQLGDLIWARDAHGRYLLGRVKGAPRFAFKDPKDRSNAEQYDMHHVVPVDLPGGQTSGSSIVDREVPGLVKARFSQGPTLQKIRDTTSRRYSDWLYNQKENENCRLELPRYLGPFLDLLDSYDLEDLVSLYLQERGWRVILSSHAKNTPRFEATFMHCEHGSAGLQVKHKGTKILPATRYALDQQVDQVFLFAATGNYGDIIPDNVHIIEKTKLTEFAFANQALLTGSLQYWLKISNEGSN